MLTSSMPGRVKRVVVTVVYTTFGKENGLEQAVELAMLHVGAFLINSTSYISLRIALRPIKCCPVEQ